MGASHDITIVGGGILGVILAGLAAEQGMRTMLLRLPDGPRPTADTLRNQSWLQSGIRYVRADKVLAAKMWTHGRRLLDFFGLKTPNGRGVIQVPSEIEAEQLYEDAVELGIGAQIRQLRADEAKRAIGPLYIRNGVSFEVPESPFEEAALLVEARETARAAGVEFREVSEPVRLVSLPGKLPSHRIVVGGQEFESGVTVLAAGAGNVPLLAALGSSIRLDLRQTPLLVIPGAPLIQAPILLDRFHKLSVVAHAPGTCRPDGCMVIGTGVHEFVDFCPPERRQVSAGTQQQVFAQLPRCIQEKLKGARFTAGWEPMPFRDGKRAPAIDPWVEVVDGHPDVIVSIPGRATLALHAAEMVLETVLGRPPRARPEDGESAPLPGNGWDESATVHMHHEQFYDGFDDAER